MIKLKKFIKTNKTILSIVSMVFLSFGFINVCYADVIEKALNYVLAGIAGIVAMITGSLTLMAIESFIKVAQYNNFTNEQAIIDAWIVIRDICNMFFILILLVIAFATILQLENYSMKRWLPKLIIMVILINFSRMIVGVLIDASQIVMLTFVNTFSETGGNFFTFFKMDDLFSTYDKSAGGWTESNGDTVTVTNLVVGYGLGVILMIVTLVTMIAILIVVVMRVIMLWIYVALSPFGFFLMSFPGGAKYSSQYWGELVRYLINGPVLAFFVWLALSTINSASFNSFEAVATDGMSSTAAKYTLSAIGDLSNFIPFVMAIGFLVGGLMISSQVGGAGSSWGASTVSNLKSKGISGIKGIGRGAVTGLDWANRKQALHSGFDFNLVRTKDKIKTSMERSKRRDLGKIDEKASDHLVHGGFRGATLGLASSGWGDHHLRGYFGWQGIKSTFAGSKKKLNNMSQESEDLKWKAAHTYESDLKLDHAIESKKMEAEERKRNGDIGGHDELKSEYKKMEARRSELVGSEKDKTEMLARSQKLSKSIASRRVDVSASEQIERQQRNEEKKNVNANDEDELISQFESAHAKNNPALAAAIAEKLAQIGSTNTLLQKYGYQASAGYTEAEKAELLKKSGGKEEYEKSKGLNDFMRDIFMDKKTGMGMKAQSVYRLQNDLGSIAESTGHEHLTKAVTVDKVGNLYQTEHKQRERTKLSEKLKRDPEKIARNNNRLDYGGEDIHADPNDNFRWSDSGLAYFISNMGVNAKEIEQGRFNKSAARAMAQKHSQGVLRDKLRELKYSDDPNDKDPNGKPKPGVLMIDDRKGGHYTITEFLNNLNKYAAQSKNENFDTILGYNK